MSGITLTGNSGGSSGIGTGAVELTETGGRALKLQTDTPHLVSMGGGRLSTAVTLHPIPQGRVTLGSGPGVDIPVQGTGVSPLHCHIENSEGVVTIYPLGDHLSIDGVPVTAPTRLSQGVMLTIGRSNYMRFNHPAEAKLMKSVLPNSRISMAPITFEVDNNTQSKTPKKPPVVPRKSPRGSLSDSGSDDPPSSIMTKVSKFEYLAAQNLKSAISPKVFSANLVTVNTPAKDVLGKAPPDLQSLTKHLPQSALNYADNDKQKSKIPEQRQIFGRKSPNYVNVTINETKTINNRVFIYENGGCTQKNQNVNLDHNDLNIVSKTSAADKNVNVGRILAPSPGYNRNPTPYYRSATASPVPCNVVQVGVRSVSCERISKKSLSGSLEDLAHRQNEAEVQRNKAQADRIKEQEIEKAEQARLEEILNMCAEYEKQSSCEKQNKPTPNRIKTNGSLPRDKRNQLSQSPYGSPTFSPPASPRDPPNSPKLRNHSYENVTVNHFQSPNSPMEQRKFHYENVEVLNHDGRNPSSPYENVTMHNNSTPYPQSPRTRIKTFISKDSSPKDPLEIVENKYAILNKEQQYLLQNMTMESKEIPVENTESHQKATPSKFILPLEEDETKNYGNDTPKQNGTECDSSTNFNSLQRITQAKERIESLKKEKREKSIFIARIKRQLAEIEIQEEELQRELEMERALITGEYKSKLEDLEKLETRKQRLLRRAQKIEASMRDSQMKQENDQTVCKRKVEIAKQNMQTIEEKLAAARKPSDEYDQVFEEFLIAQEILENETKNFEDLEFHHLEEKADWLASREELQREINDLSQKIENIRVQITELEQQKQDASRANTNEFKTMERQRMEQLVKLETARNELKSIDLELRTFSNQDSEPDVSTDSDSDKSKEMCLTTIIPPNMSCSMIEHPKVVQEEICNMSQSFNEKMFLEKSVLDGGIARKCPSQDDIDRISKVTSNAPISIDEQTGSLGRKTIESLKEIEIQRHLHLCQQGSQVIENERQRVLALKQKVQEVRSTWAQRKQDCSSYTSTSGSEGNSATGSEGTDQKNETSTGNETNQSDSLRTESECLESPRPLSETSELSVEVGGTLGRRNRNKTPDKHRPLTRYLPIRGSDLDLRQHIESAGHQVVLCPHVIINSTSCRGFLHKKGSKLNGWSRRWFVFDRNKHTFVYYADKTEKKPRGGSYFQAIEEVYLDHFNAVKSPNPNLTFIVKTHERFYYLMAPSPEAMRIWVDVIFTGAEGYQEYEHGT